MNSILVYAGQKSSIVSLNSVLREAHESFKIARNKQIEERKKKGIPLDDDTDLQFTEQLKKKIQSETSTSELAELASQLFTACNGNELKPVGDFVESEACNGISIQFKMISQADRRVFQAELGQIIDERRDAFRQNDKVKASIKFNEFEACSFKLIQQCICAIEGIDGISDFNCTEENKEMLIDALDTAGILQPLYTAVNFFLELPRKKALHCGAQLQSN